MRTIILICASIIAFNVKGQVAYSWSKQTGGISPDDSQCLAYDASGNVYIAGAFQGTVDFDPGPGTTTLVSAGSDDAFISKFDPNGNFLAVYTFTNNLFCKIYGIAIDNSGAIITTGGFSGSVDFDPSATVYSKTSNGALDIFVCKLNASGNLAWVKTIGSFGSDDIGISVACDPSDNVLVTGYFQGSNVNFDVGASNFLLSASGGTKDVFVLKLNTVGNFSWAFNLGSSTASTADVGQTIKCDGSGNVYVGGYFNNTVDFDPGLGNATIFCPAGSSDAFVAKYSTSGAYIWAKSFGGNSDDVCYGLSIDPSGDVHSIGTFKGACDFDPGAGTFILTSFGGTNEDVFISKINPTGGFIWAKQFGGIGVDFGTSISSDASGVYLTGYFSGVADFDPSTTTTVNLISNGANDVFISKLDVSGNYLFAKSIGGVGNDFGRAIITPSTNIIYSTGSFSNTADFDISPYAISTSTSVGNSDAFLLKLIPCAVQGATVVASSSTICAGSSVNLIASSAFSYSWNTSANTNSITVSPTVSTTYSVIVTLVNGCAYSNTVNVQVVVCNNLQDQNMNNLGELNVFPNPAYNNITILSQRKSTLKIINDVGQLVKEIALEEGQNSFSITDFKCGVYCFIVGQDKFLITKKVIIH